MKREIRTTLTFTAAVLSVIAVPLITALVAHLNAALMAAIVGAAGAAVAALVTLVFWAYSQGMASGQQAGRLAEDQLRIELLEKSLAEVRAELVTQRARNARRRDPIDPSAAVPSELQVLSELAAIEVEARALLGEGPTASIIRLRSRLQDSGVWSEEDVYDFDVALRTRNKVAHGDQDGLTKTSLTEAIETMERLRRKLEATQISPPSN